MLRRIITFFSIGLIFYLFTGCAKPKKPELTPPTVEKKEPTFNSALGEVFLGKVGDVDLTGLPKKLVYPGAKPLARHGKYETPRWGCSYNFETRDQPDAIWRYYHNLLAGWKLVDSNEVKEWNYKFETYVAEGDKEVVQVNVTKKEEKTVIVICHTYNEL